MYVFVFTTFFYIVGPFESKLDVVMLPPYYSSMHRLRMRIVSYIIRIIIGNKEINSISKMLSSLLHFNGYLLDLSLSLKFEGRRFRHYGGLTENFED